MRRMGMMFILYRYDKVFVHREAASIGPPVFEWMISRLFRKQMLFEFDDAIWLRVSSAANPGAALLKCSWKVANICRMSSTVVAGNPFLADYARQYCKDVRIIPTVVDTDHWHNMIKDQIELPVCIGWTGTFTNFFNLQMIVPAIRQLQQEYSFRFLIIADKDPKFEHLDYEFCKWKFDTEIKDLLQMHIGLMPLSNGAAEQGKCGFKAIQYMSLGIPAVVSPEGVNKHIVIDGETGYWAQRNSEYVEKLRALLINPELRTEMGQKARAHIIKNYSVAATREKFMQLFS